MIEVGDQRSEIGKKTEDEKFRRSEGEKVRRFGIGRKAEIKGQRPENENLTPISDLRPKPSDIRTLTSDL